MAAVIRDFNYSKARGRGRGILGLKEFNQCRKPGGNSGGNSDPGLDKKSE